MKAVGYSRWSSLEQGRGSTLARQQGQIRSFCEAKGWTLIEQLTDEGTSAYTGANIQTGNLAALLNRIETGDLPNDVVIVVEQLDRISRLPPSRVVNWINRVVATGASIATVNDGQVIDQYMIDANPMNFMSLVFNSFRAFQESKHKSERLAASWAMKRKALESGTATPITSVCPAWLRLDKSVEKFVEVPERAAIVREIFDRTIDGEGKAAIAASLNARGIAAWGRGASQADGWHASYVQKILSNPAVIGEFQPHTKARGDLKRTPIGEPVRGYYPAVISAEQWARVRSSKPRKRGGGSGFKGEIRNLFSGLCRCAVCGGAMAYQLKGKEGSRLRSGRPVAQKRSSYLFCSRRVRKLDCSNGFYYRYEHLENGILDGILGFALRDSFFSSGEAIGALSAAFYQVTREVEAQQARVDRLISLYEETGDSDIKQRWLDARQRLAAVSSAADAAKDALERARGNASPQEHAERVASVRNSLDDADADARRTARQKVMHSLREVVDYMTFDDAGRIGMVFHSGAMAVRFNQFGEILGDVQRFEGQPTTPETQSALLAALDDHC